MKNKHFVLIVAGFAACILCSCGHNAIVFGKGLGLRAGFDPEHFSADVSFLYGEQVVVAGRDNIKIKLKTGVNGGQENATASTSADSVFEIEIGQQINGYFCDAVKAGADAKDLVKMNEADTAKYLESEYEKAWKIARERGPEPLKAVKPADETPAPEEEDATAAAAN